jgi:hypothetical protein
MMAVHAQVLNEFHMVKDELFAIPEVERVFVSSSQSVLDVTVIVPDNNPAVLDKVVSVEANLIDAFPWLDVDFDIIFRCGRSLNDVVLPQGSLLFSR